MKEPIRWQDDPRIGGELRDWLGQVPPARPLDAATRRRMARRLSRTLAIPLVLTSWLTLKTAAASLAVTAGAITLGAVAAHEIRVVRELSVPIATSHAVAAARSVRPVHAASPASPSGSPAAPTPAPAARFADLDGSNAPDVIATANALPAALPVPAASGQAAPSVALELAVIPSGPAAPRRELRAAVGRAPNDTLALASPELRAAVGRDPNDALASASPVGVVSTAKPAARTPRDDLTTEATLLELARRALANSPSDALALVEEHRTSFPHATLGLERELIRVEALNRLGRKQEALSLAQGLRQRGGLYTERIDRLIRNIEGAGM